MKRRCRAVAAAAALLCLTAFLSSCEKTPEVKEYKPYDYDLASYLSMGSVIGVSYIPADETVTEAEIEYRITRELREAGFYESDLSELVLTEPQGEVKLGDVIVMDCTATVDDVPFPDASAADMQLELGSGSVAVEGFEAGLAGCEIGEEVELTLALPSDYSDFAMRGKLIEFTVTVKSVETRYLCPDTLTDGQLSKLGEYADFSEYCEQIRVTLEEEKKQYAEQKKQADCWLAALDRVTLIAYPQVEMEMYMEEYLAYTAEQAKEAGFSDLETYAASLGTTYDGLTAQGMEYARGDVLQEMVVYSVARAEGFDNMSDELFGQFALPYAEELGLESVDQLVEVVGFNDVQKLVLTDVVKQYIANNAVPILPELPVDPEQPEEEAE